VRLLVAEDVQRLADDIAEGLRDQGFAVDVAYDGLEAATKIEVNDYDVVVLIETFPAFTATPWLARSRRWTGRR